MWTRRYFESTNNNNLSIDGIKRYTGTPDLSSMTDANIVSWTDAYTAYEQNPSAYLSIIPEGTRLCPIYMWFENLWFLLNCL